MTEIYEAGRRNGKTVESIAEAVREAVCKGVDAGVIKAPVLTPVYVGMDSAINPIYKVKADGFATGGLIPKPKPEVRFWEDCKIQRNGKYTTVIWKDGTVTRVTCQDSDEPDDLRAFEEALAKKLYGSRTALKKFVEARTVDVARKKVGKKTSKRWKNDRKRRENGEVIARDSNGVELKAGDTVYIKDFSDVDWGNKIYRIDKIGDCAIEVGEGVGYLPSECFTKVRTEPPFKIGDWVAITPPKEGESTFGFTLDYIRELAKKPFEVLGVRADDVLEVNHVVDNEERTIYIKKDWVRKA